MPSSLTDRFLVFSQWAISLLYASCLCSQCPRYQRLHVLNKLRLAHYRGSRSSCETCPSVGYMCTGYTDVVRALVLRLKLPLPPVSSE